MCIRTASVTSCSGCPAVSIPGWRWRWPVDALGPEHVHTVMMPSRHTSGLSIELAQEQAVKAGGRSSLHLDRAGIRGDDDADGTFLLRAGTTDITEENLQARIRGNMVMALSNKFGWLPLATSNKSELAVGYCTIYGDMCGGFGPSAGLLQNEGLRVVPLPQQPVAPPSRTSVITRAPSAELRPDQSDQDSLPPYEQLDGILKRYVELDWSICAKSSRTGFEDSVVRRIAGLVLLNEYKTAPGAARCPHHPQGVWPGPALPDHVRLACE